MYRSKRRKVSRYEATVAELTDFWLIRCSLKKRCKGSARVPVWGLPGVMAREVNGLRKRPLPAVRVPGRPSGTNRCGRSCYAPDNASAGGGDGQGLDDGGST